jgi:hypothetical protein
MDNINFVLECFSRMGATEDQLVNEFTRFYESPQYFNDWLSFLVNN